MIRRTLVVMVKEPIAGRVKTRLAAGIGAVAATQFYRATTAAVLQRVARRERADPVRRSLTRHPVRSRAPPCCAADTGYLPVVTRSRVGGAPRALRRAREGGSGSDDQVRTRRDHGRSEWETVLAVAPDVAIRSRAWPMSLPRIAQGPGDLRRRMQCIMDWSWRGPVVIVGSDIPGIRCAHIRAAFAALGASDAVFGPAADGGYWLVGLKRIPRVPRAFGNVRWSTKHALADTRANLAGLRIAEVAPLHDVDEKGDLARAGNRCLTLRL